MDQIQSVSCIPIGSILDIPNESDQSERLYSVLKVICLQPRLLVRGISARWGFSKNPHFYPRPTSYKGEICPILIGGGGKHCETMFLNKHCRHVPACTGNFQTSLFPTDKFVISSGRRDQTKYHDIGVEIYL